MHAKNLEDANVIIGINSFDPDTVIIDDTNFAIESLSKIMENADYYKLLYLLSEYRKGSIDTESSIKKIVDKYNAQYADVIMQYIIHDNDIKLVAAYEINNGEDDLFTININGLTDPYSMNIDATATTLLNLMKRFLPESFYKNIEKIYMEFNNNDNKRVYLVPANSDATKWDFHIDLDLLKEENEEDFYKNLIYSSVYYYVLNNDQIDFLSPKKENYSYDNYTFKSDSYINKFYKKFWKKRRNEVKNGQYEIYKNEFFNSKASCTVYDDMAVSFYNYTIKGIMRRNLGFRADKNNFFEEIPLFKQLAVRYRVLFGITMS